MHDWSDKYCVQILRQLRNAATPDTRLLIVDNLMAYACVDKNVQQIYGTSSSRVPPEPLLPNGGHAVAAKYYEDIQVRSYSD